MKRTAITLLLLVIALMSAAVGPVAADSAKPTEIVRPSPSGISISAMPAVTCPAGSFCAWPNTTGADRCRWTNADYSWRDAPVVCSWSETRQVQMVWNNGTSPNYDGVCLYYGFSYKTHKVFLWQGEGAVLSEPFRARSHKWVGPGEPCE
jgi:hypothetical protein